ncbi:inorganic phosphate transporter [bacterium]|nr:inorganic phosphate transporter [bacterium]
MTETIILSAVVIVGFYMAWNIGANDVANAMGTSVGSKAITFTQAVILAGIFELLGAILVGGNVTRTISKGIISLDATSDVSVFIIGMLSALLASAIWLNVASRLGLPVSTTHSIVGAVMGFGIVAYGFGAVNWNVAVAIVLSWVISPLFGGILSFFLFWFLLRNVIATENPVEAIKKVAPYLIFAVATILSLSMLYKGLKNLNLNLPFFDAIIISLTIGLLAFGLGRQSLKRIKNNNESSFAGRMKAMEKVFIVLQVITACYVAFAHGANDVANAVGPVAAVYEGIKSGQLLKEVPVPFWVLVMGGIGIVVGLATYGRHVIKMVGENIMNLRPSRGFAAEFGCATTVLVCSKLGLPVSTTHTLIGALVGVGFARGMGALNMKNVKMIVVSWLWTIPFTAVLTIILFFIAKAALL